MFDWDDQELANIIWGEAGESDDHIVPYPEASDDYHNKKEWYQESDTTKPTEQKTPVAKIDLHVRKPQSISNLETSEGISTSGFRTDSWPDSSLPSFAKTEQQCLGTEASDNLTEITNFDEANQLKTDAEIFQISNEGQEQGDFADYGWSTIGSFDDLDRILSNDDAIFGHVNLGSADELWSSSRDATNSPTKAFPLSSDSPSSRSQALQSSSENLEIKTENVQQDDQSITPGYGKMDYTASHGLQNAHATLDHGEYSRGKRKPMEKEQTGLDIGKTTVTNSYLASANSSTPNEIACKVSRPRKLLRSRKQLVEKNEGKPLQDVYGNWSSSRNPSGQFENQLPCLMVQSSPSSVLSQKRQLQGSESFPYQHVSNQFVALPMYGTLTNPYHAAPVLSHIQPGEYKHQRLVSSYGVSRGNANPINKSADTSAKPLTMTPQEKIEKLRRRQQLQAMLAIQKQQQQFSHQISCTNQSTTQKCPEENQIRFDRADLEVEDLSTIPSLDPNSPVEQDDSSTISAAVDGYSPEDTILYRLQDIISKLDIKIRLCIRDSLFRLAQSAMQRHYASDNSTSNKSSKDEHEVIAKEEINSRNSYARMPDVETETNPIDRTVAHLLFHRPLESGKLSDPPESPISTKLPHKRKTAGSLNLSNGCLPDSLNKKQSFPHHESEKCCQLGEPQSSDQFRNSPCMDNSENASNNGPGDGETMEAEASQ